MWPDDAPVTFSKPYIILPCTTVVKDQTANIVKALSSEFDIDCMHDAVQAAEDCLEALSAVESAQATEMRAKLG